MAVQRELFEAGTWVPKPDASVLRAREHPFRVGSKRDAEGKVLCRLLTKRCCVPKVRGEMDDTHLVAHKRLDAAAPLGRGLLGLLVELPWYCQLPHFYTNQFRPSRGEGNTIDTILMARQKIQSSP